MLQTAQDATALPHVPSAPDPQPDPDPDAGDRTDRAAARLAAHRLVQDVQLRDTGSTCADQLAAAEARGWSDVVLVLLYADLVRAWTMDSEDYEEVIERLHDRAHQEGDMVLLASALASRAECRYGSASAAVREHGNRDLARAAALLAAGAGAGRDLERATAYIDCGLAYLQRELWELADQMFAQATTELRGGETDILDRALSLNRAICLVDTACSMHELHQQQELEQLWDRVVPTRSAGEHLFDVAERVALHLLARLIGQVPAEQSRQLDRALEDIGGPYEQPQHGLLRLADAVAAAAVPDWDEVARLTSEGNTMIGSDFGPPVVALGLRLATRAELAQGSRGAGSALAYCDWSARRRWDGRLQLLAAARSMLETEQLRVERDEHAREAQVDELTGLGNRRAYTRRVEQLRESGHGRPVSVLVVDVDAFKSVNDTYGHDVGDTVLVAVGGVLSAVTRPVDLVARLGGDEFVVLLESLDDSSARRRAGEVLDRCATVDWSAAAPGLRVQVSIGVATGPADDPQRLFVRADRALYATKARGGDGVTVAAD